VAAEAEVGGGVTCPICCGTVELPEPSYPAWCPTCDVFFREVAEMGWFDYSVTVYALEGE